MPVCFLAQGIIVFARRRSLFQSWQITAVYARVFLLAFEEQVLEPARLRTKILLGRVDPSA
jgi:hypothetical protein